VIFRINCPTAAIGFQVQWRPLLFAIQRKILIVPNHHFGYTFFTQNKTNEKQEMLELLKEFTNLRCFDATQG
jgi:hypothetical protein